MRPEPSTRRMPGSHHRLGGAPELLEPVIHNNNNKNSTKSNNNNSTTTKTNSKNNTNSNYSNSNKTNCNGRSDRKNRNDNSNTSQKNGSPVRLPYIEGKRSSKSRASSFSEVCTDLSTSQRRGSVSTNAPAMSTQRRASVPQGVTSQPVYTRRGSKPTFAGIGRRVSSLVRYKLAFQGRGQRTVPEDMPEENHMEPILQMPESPRFSTFMSPEAQYAMMKGYEDKLYEKIADVNPEYRPCLQRTRTPLLKKISIVDKDSSKEQEEEEKDGENLDSKSPTSSPTTSGYGSLPSTMSVSSFSSLSTSEVIKPLDNCSLSPESTTNTNTTSSPPTISIPCLKPLRRQSMAATTSADINGKGMMMMLNSSEEGHMHRSNSLAALDPPGGLSHNKRLVLTYRLENAMDILDSLKKRDTENSLSPRVVRGLPWHVDAVKDFNSWTKVWNKEFKEVQK